MSPIWVGAAAHARDSLGAQGGAVAETAVRPRPFLPPPQTASRGLGSGASGARSLRVRKRGLVRGSEAKESGGSSVLSGPRPGSSPSPRVAPGSPPASESLGRAWTEADVVGSDFPAAVPRPPLWGGGVSWKARLPAQAGPRSRGLERRSRPAARGGQGWGAHRPAPHASRPHPGAAGFPALGRAGVGGTVGWADPGSAPRGPSRAWNKGLREGWGEGADDCG